MGLDSGVLVASVKRGGEKHHAGSIQLSEVIRRGTHIGICSSLALVEVPGALASSTTMPVEEVYGAELSLIEGFRISFSDFETYMDTTVEMMLEFRGLKRKFDVGSADFHHIATARSEGCPIFATTDERHLLRPECRDQFSKYIRICTPAEAAAILREQDIDRSPLRPS